MEIQTTIIDNYLQGKPLCTKEDVWLFSNEPKADQRRKEVVEELKRQAVCTFSSFPTYNAPLFYQLFPSIHSNLSNFVIQLIVGSNTFYRKVTMKDKTYLVFDLIQCANMTPIVSQMMYLLLHTLHYEIAKTLLLTDYPLPLNSSYTAHLNHLSFIEGFAYYLSWNSDADHYRFHDDHYEQQKEKAFGSLLNAFEVTSVSLQNAILTSLPKLSLWDQFPATAALFYIDDCYRSEGIDAITHLYQRGWTSWIQTIFDLKEN